MKTGRNRLGRKDHQCTGARPASACPGGCAGRLCARRWPRWRLARLPPRPGPAAPRPPSPKRPRRPGGIVFSPMRWAGATWYGPGLYGNRPPAASPAAGNDRRRPPQPSLRHHGQVRLPRPPARHPGDRPRPLQPRQRLGPDQRRPPGARLRQASARLRYAVSLEYAAPAVARLRRIGRCRWLVFPAQAGLFNERSTGMSRSSQRAVSAGSAGVRGRLALASSAGGLPRAPRRAGRRRRRGDDARNDRRPRQHRDRARPLLPGAALPGGRQRHRLPGQHRPGIAALQRAQRRQGQGVDADPGPADQQPALLLQRLLRHAAGGAPGDPAPRPGHRAAPLQPAQPGLDPRAQPLPRARRSSSAPR